MDDAALTVVSGELPRGLRGVLYRNGPVQLAAYGTRYAHPFDGDGLVRRFAFDGAAVTMRSRLVRTRELAVEEARGARVYRSLGTNAPGGLRANLFNTRFKNAANTSVVVHGGRLFALWEGGAPHALDPVTLATQERSQLGGALENRFGRVERWLNPELPFGAHPKVDPATGELVNIGVAYGVRPRLLVYRVSPRGEVDVRAIALGGVTFVHDFALAGDYVVVFLNPLAFGMFGLLAGLTAPIASVAPTGKGARILILRRDGQVVFDALVPARYVMHCVNGFVSPEGDVILDVVSSADPPPFADMKGVYEGATPYPETKLTRYTCSITAGAAREETRFNAPLEFPTVAPRDVGRPYATAYAVAGRMQRQGATFDSIARVDSSAGAHRVRRYREGVPGEPVFVPGPAGAGVDYLLTLVASNDGATTWLDVLDAETLATYCRLELPAPYPPDLHGVWTSLDVCSC